MKKLRRRRLVTVIVSLVIFGAVIVGSPDLWQQAPVESAGIQGAQTMTDSAAHILETLEVKGRAPKTGYARTQFGNGWSNNASCDTRNTILYRDMTDTVTDENCRVVSGVLHDPYTGTVIEFERGPQTSQSVQIDHVVALSNAWQTGAQGLTDTQRVALANDPLNLLAVAGAANQQKSDSDAASWLPSNKSFRCQYVARQIAVKKKYTLWVTPAEKEVILRVLRACPNQISPVDHVDMIQ